MPRRTLRKADGLCPSFGIRPMKRGQSPDEGRSPDVFEERHRRGITSPHIRRRSEEHTSELQSLAYLVCRLLLEKKKREGALALSSASDQTEHIRESFAVMQVYF